jgi:hypothetical protein
MGGSVARPEQLVGFLGGDREEIGEIGAYM